MKSLKSGLAPVSLLIATLLAGSVTYAAPSEPAAGNFDIQKAVGTYGVTQLLVKSVYSYGSQEQDLSSYWTKTVLNATSKDGSLTLINTKPGISTLNASFENINGGEIPSQPANGDLSGTSKSLTYTTSDGIFYKRSMVLNGTPGASNSSHSYYESKQLTLLPSGDFQLKLYKEDCPGSAGSCGEIGPTDQYSSSETYTVTLKK